MRETLGQMLTGVEYVGKAKRIANNTVRYMRANGDEVVRLHHTDIVVKHPDGTFTLSSGGWRTSTTKDRLNGYSPARIGQDKGEWYLFVGEGRGWSQARVPFNDGMRVDTEGRPIGYKPDEAEAKSKERKALARSINKFVKLVDTLPKEQLLPSSGDCFLCSIFEQGQPSANQWNCNNGAAEPGSNVDHLYSHIEEGYVPGALLFNAVQWAGYKDAMLILHMGYRDLIKRALRRYLRRKLGLG